MSKKPSLQIPQPLLNVVDDNGYAAHKLAWYEAGVIKTLKVDTLIELGRRTDAVGDPIDTYLADGTSYYCASNVRTALKLRNDNYPVSVANRVLVTHALNKANLVNKPIKLGVTLPFRDYYTDRGIIRQERKDATIANFAGPERQVEIDGKQQDKVVDVREATCFSEGVSAYFDFAFNDDGTQTVGGMNVTGEIAVVDIGGSTTDVVSLNVDAGLMIDQEHSGTERAGVLDALHALGAMMKVNLVNAKVIAEGVDSDIPNSIIQRALEKGEAFYQGRMHDFRDEQEKACRMVAERVTNYVASKLGNINVYQVIIVVGGGSIVFQKWLKESMPNAVFLDEFSNARGALKYMQYC